MSRYAMCPDCGHCMRRDKDIFEYWDGETYICDDCAGNEYDGEDEDGEGISVYDAAEIWLPNGMDENSMFGYTEDKQKIN